jgi:hypothetical protein
MRLSVRNSGWCRRSWGRVDVNSPFVLTMRRCAVVGSRFFYHAILASNRSRNAFIAGHIPRWVPKAFCTPIELIAAIETRTTWRYYAFASFGGAQRSCCPLASTIASFLRCTVIAQRITEALVNIASVLTSIWMVCWRERPSPATMKCTAPWMFFSACVATLIESH